MDTNKIYSHFFKEGYVFQKIIIHHLVTHYSTLKTPSIMNMLVFNFQKMTYMHKHDAYQFLILLPIKKNCNKEPKLLIEPKQNLCEN